MWLSTCLATDYWQTRTDKNLVTSRLAERSSEESRTSTEDFTAKIGAPIPLLQFNPVSLVVMPDEKEEIERRMDELAREYGIPRDDPRREEIADELHALCLQLDRLVN
jgi:hypothetical protein